MHVSRASRLLAAAVRRHHLPRRSRRYVLHRNRADATGCLGRHIQGHACPTRGDAHHRGADHRWRAGRRRLDCAHPSRPARWRPTTRCTATDPAAHHGLGRLRRRRAVLRVQLRRSRSVRHQDVDHPPRQHLGRRLGRPQPRRARHRTDVVPPDGQPERHPARHDQHASPATKTRRRTGSGTAPAASPTRLRRRDPTAAADASGSRAATTCGWASSSGGGSAASASRCRGRRSSRASGCSRTHAPLSFKDLQPWPPRELIPSATYSRTRRAPRRRRWDRRRDGDLGMSGKWGLTSDGHARRDAQSGFQPGRERRLPGRGQPALSGLLLREAAVLHGRRRPASTSPATGRATRACSTPSTRGTSSTRSSARSSPAASGASTFGSLTAIDQAPGAPRIAPTALHGKREAVPDRPRAGGPEAGSYAGAIGTFTELAGRDNAVGRRRSQPTASGSQRITGFVLGSSTTGDVADRNRAGVGTQVELRLQHAAGAHRAQIEHYDRGFVMDTAFLNRVGITCGLGLRRLQLLSGQGSTSLDSPHLALHVPRRRGRDRIADGDEYTGVTGAATELHAAGILSHRPGLRPRALAGPAVRQRPHTPVRSGPAVPLAAAATAPCNWGAGDVLRRARSVPGQSLDTRSARLLQPNGRFTRGHRVPAASPSIAPHGRALYTCRLLNTRTTYQFSTDFAARGIVQYDSQVSAC